MEIRDQHSRLQLFIANLIESVKTGHPGAAISLTPLFHTLFSKILVYDPDDSRFGNRDILIMSNGHACSVLYLFLHLTGRLSLDELLKFRQVGSLTPGHPETFTSGVEVITGPLGQGLGCAVGFGMSIEKVKCRFEDIFNRLKSCDMTLEKKSCMNYKVNEKNKNGIIENIEEFDGVENCSKKIKGNHDELYKNEENDIKNIDNVDGAKNCSIKKNKGTHDELIKNKENDIKNNDDIDGVENCFKKIKGNHYELIKNKENGIKNIDNIDGAKNLSIKKIKGNQDELIKNKENDIDNCIKTENSKDIFNNKSDFKDSLKNKTYVNENSDRIFNPAVFCIFGDGCYQEGISHEAFSLAGHYKLGNMIFIYDCNEVTIDGQALLSMSDSPKKRFEGYGFDVVEINGNDFLTIEEVLSAKLFQIRGNISCNGDFDVNKKYNFQLKSPLVVILKTRIADGTDLEGNSKSHGAPLGSLAIDNFKKKFKLDDVGFCIDNEIYNYFTVVNNRMRNNRILWNKKIEALYNEVLKDHEKVEIEIKTAKKMNEENDSENIKNNDENRIKYKDDNDFANVFSKNNDRVSNNIFNCNQNLIVNDKNSDIFAKISEKNDLFLLQSLMKKQSKYFYDINTSQIYNILKDMPIKNKRKASRVYMAEALEEIARYSPFLLSGSADLTPSCLTKNKHTTDIVEIAPIKTLFLDVNNNEKNYYLDTEKNPENNEKLTKNKNDLDKKFDTNVKNKNNKLINKLEYTKKDLYNINFNNNYLRYGIREHGMFSTMNGISSHGFYLPLSSTFLNFATYGWHSIRLAALAGHNTVYTLTHDSVLLGDDGPTHQPIETIALMRCTPGIILLRPCDCVETRFSLWYALSRGRGEEKLLKFLGDKHVNKNEELLNKNDDVILNNASDDELKLDDNIKNMKCERTDQNNEMRPDSKVKNKKGNIVSKIKEEEEVETNDKQSNLKTNIQLEDNKLNMIYDQSGPVVICLTRQALDNIEGTNFNLCTKGAYIVYRNYKSILKNEHVDITILATGSEVSLAIKVAKKLYFKINVVSFLSFEIFESQNDAYKSSILDGFVFSLEALSTMGWHKYANYCFGIDRFGLSGKGDDVYKFLGFSEENVSEKLAFEYEKFLSKK